MSRKNELMGVLYHLREHTITRAPRLSALQIMNAYISLKKELSEVIDEVKLRMEQNKKDKKLLKNIMKADKALKKLNFDIYVELKRVSANITTTPQAKQFSINRLFEIGVKK